MASKLRLIQETRRWMGVRCCRQTDGDGIEEEAGNCLGDCQWNRAAPRDAATPATVTGGSPMVRTHLVDYGESRAEGLRGSTKLVCR